MYMFKYTQTMYMSKNSTCVVFICDTQYFDKFINTYTQLITVGRWSGDVCLVVCDELYESPQLADFVSQNKIIVKYFEPIVFPPEFVQSQTSLNRADHWNKKMFQFNKLYVFDMFFKQWDYIFYLDCGIHIFSDITPIVQCAEPGKVLAHSDTYPKYNNTLNWQFDSSTSLFRELQSQYNLNGDYPQTTIMLYDTQIITPTTFRELVNLSIKYPISISNDQGILALYFTRIRPLWKQIPTENENVCFYDYLARVHKNKPYIMLKVTHIWDSDTTF